MKNICKCCKGVVSPAFKEKNELYYVDELGNEYKKIAENEDYFFISPFKVLDDGGKELDFTKILTYSKDEPEHPVSSVIKYG